MNRTSAPIGATATTTAVHAKQKMPIRFRALEKVRVHPPSLVQTCLKRVAANFLKYENLHLKLARKQLEDVYAMLDISMPLSEAASRIADESYWKRRTQAKHRNAQVEKHGLSWKQTFLELELQQALEALPITVEYGSPELESLKQQVLASRAHIFQLTIAQFPSHIDLSFLFDALPALCCFSVTYGNKRLGMDYERAMFGMKISDAQHLARNIRVSQTLIALALPCNMIDDELVKVLMGGLSYAHMLTSLDLSHNKIGDRGARRIATLLDPDYCMQSLDLSDNQIHANGCMHLGAHLAENVSCEALNLRLNRCEDNGVSHLFQDMCVNKYLKTLNISCNDLTVRCLPYMNSMLSENTTLRELDLTANPLYSPDGEDANNLSSTQDPGLGASLMDTSALNGLAGEDSLAGVSMSSQFGIFVRCLMRSPALLKVDIRQCGLPAELAEKITTTVKHRELRSKGIPVEAYERSKLAHEDTVEAAIDEEVAEGEGEDEESDGEAGAGGEDAAPGGEEGATGGEEGAAGATGKEEEKATG